MVQNEIISWYINNKRSLPWRKTQNPYFIWLSEIILQQTRVAQGLPYYEKFVERFPKIEDLAAADESEVLRLWQGLGYYSRGRNLHKTAKFIAHDLNGNFPESYEMIVKLNGVGPYTAAAIASFAFKEQVPAIDGNVIRSVSRLYKIDKPVDAPSTLKEIKVICNELIKDVEPDFFNQAMMEFGAVICTPKSPKCDICPVRVYCLSYPAKDYLRIPFKAKKTKVSNRDIYYLVLKTKNKIFLKKRSEADIWQSLFDFPEVKPDQLEFFINTLTPEKVNVREPISHILSHQKLSVYFWVMNVEQKKLNLTGDWYTFDEAENLPKPKIIADFILDLSLLN